MTNPFFRNTGPYEINELLKLIDLKSEKLTEEKVFDIKDLSSAQNKDITFFHSNKYSELAKKTKASYCITTEKFKSILPSTCNVIISNKVLLHTAQITKIFYPESITDDFDSSVKDIIKTDFKDKVNYNLIVSHYLRYDSVGIRRAIDINTTTTDIQFLCFFSYIFADYFFIQSLFFFEFLF